MAQPASIEDEEEGMSTKDKNKQLAAEISTTYVTRKIANIERVDTDDFHGWQVTFAS